MISFEFLGNNNTTYVLSEDLYNIFNKFSEKYISKGICFADKMKIPISEVNDLSSQIEKVILDKNIILSENEKFSANEDSLRTLAFEIVRSRCIRGKELRTSFKQLDKVYHLDDTETKEALKGKMQLPRPFCCVPNCKCAEFLMSGMIKSFPSLIKSKLRKFVVELEILDKIVIDSLLTSSDDRSSSNLRKKISRRPLVVQRSERVEKEIMKEFLENLIDSKNCENITYQKLMENKAISFNDDDLETATFYSVNDVTGSTKPGDKSLKDLKNIIQTEPISTKSDKQDNANPFIENQVISSTIDSDISMKGNSKEVQTNQDSSPVTSADNANFNQDSKTALTESTIAASDNFDVNAGTIAVTESAFNAGNKEISTNSSFQLNKNDSSENKSAVTIPLTVSTSRNSIISTTLPTTFRTTRRQGGLFNRVPVRRTTSTSKSTSLTTAETVTTTTTTTTTQPPTTIAKRRFNPFLRNVFNRG